MKKTKKNYAIIVLIVLLVAISIGYSAFSSSLNISGTATGSGKWDVEFTSAVLKDASTLEVETSKEHGDDPTITPMGDYVTFNVKLSYPGDAVVLETTIKNEGTIAGYAKEIKDYIPEITILKLVMNYRNNQETINLANKFIMQNKKQIEKTVICQKNLNKPIKIINFSNKQTIINKIIPINNNI